MRMHSVFKLAAAHLLPIAAGSRLSAVPCPAALPLARYKTSRSRASSISPAWRSSDNKHGIGAAAALSGSTRAHMAGVLIRASHAGQCACSDQPCRVHRAYACPRIMRPGCKPYRLALIARTPHEAIPFGNCFYFCTRARKRYCAHPHHMCGRFEPDFSLVFIIFLSISFTLENPSTCAHAHTRAKLWKEKTKKRRKQLLSAAI